VLPRLLDAVPLQRVAVAGGDSAGAVAQALAIDTLTVAAPLAPGAPLCRAGSRIAARDGLEIVLKGGQMGAHDFFGRVIGRSTLTANRQGTP
jgi:3-oxoisoapionate kinase